MKPVTSTLLPITDTSSSAIHEATSFLRGSQFGPYWILKSHSFISFKGLGFCILKCHIEVVLFLIPGSPWLLGCDHDLTSASKASGTKGMATMPILDQCLLACFFLMLKVFSRIRVQYVNWSRLRILEQKDMF